MTKFREEIMVMANEKRKEYHSEGTEEYVTDTQVSTEIKEAMDSLFYLADLGAEIYNKALGDKELSVYKFPEELLTVFFNIPGKRMGFCIISSKRFVVFLDEEPDKVLVLGKKRQNEKTGEGALIGARQLIRITCIRLQNALVLKDNTGATLDIEDLIKHIIKWVVSE